MTRHGGCYCGKLRFEARGEPVRVGICHCLDCRKLHGAPFMAFAVFPKDAVTITGEARRVHSQPSYARCFCPECGSHVLGEDAEATEVYHGAFDETDQLPPTYELWTVRRESWIALPGVTEHHARDRNKG